MFEISPLAHIFAIAILTWLWIHLRRADNRERLLDARLLLTGTLFAWFIITSAIAFGGTYLQLAKETLLFPLAVFVPFFLVTTLAVIFKQVRQLLVQFVNHTSLASLTFINIIRIGAIGTIIHFYQGTLPGHFIIPVAFPDLAIGLSAYFMSRRAKDGDHNRLLLLWHSSGVLIFFSAVPLMLLSQPGALSVFNSGPNTDQVFSFPMVIVPTFIAPLMILFHAAAIIKLLQRIRSKTLITQHLGKPS